MKKQVRDALIVAAIALACFATTPVLAGKAESASQILKACGVKGGLVVHLGSGDGKLTAALRAGDSYLVHGLDTDAANIAKARKHIRSEGLCGKVSVDTFDGKRLPYVDNLVNLLVAEELGPGAPGMKEVMRVLAPRGVAMIDGKKLAQTALTSLPVFDGMAAAGGNLYLSLCNGTIVCFKKESER